MTRIACLCVDGAFATECVKQTVKDAFGWRGICLESRQFKYSKSRRVPVKEYRRKIKQLVENNGGDPTQIALLVVGKSLGGAKIYRLLYQYHNELKQFAKVSVVLVDPHEPLVPGDDGDTAKWYDYVYFKNGKYRLNWWEDRWGVSSSQADPKAKLRFHVAYQRNKRPRGYAMNSPYISCDLTNKTVRIPGESQHQVADHFSISKCEKTLDLIMTAIEHLQG